MRPTSTLRLVGQATDGGTVVAWEGQVPGWTIYLRIVEPARPGWPSLALSGPNGAGFTGSIAAAELVRLSDDHRVEITTDPSGVPTVPATIANDEPALIAVRRYPSGVGRRGRRRETEERMAKYRSEIRRRLDQGEPADIASVAKAVENRRPAQLRADVIRAGFQDWPAFVAIVRTTRHN